MDDQKHQVFIKAYEPCHESFLRYCSAIAYGKMDVEDLVQDVLLSAYQHFDKIRDKNQFKNYLIRAAKNRMISHWRKKKFQPELLEKHNERLIAKEVSPDTLLDIEYLYKMMDKLPDKQKQALILFEISGFSMKEIAEMQNSTQGAIKTKISRARKRLKEIFNRSDKSISSVFGTLKMIAL